MPLYLASASHIYSQSSTFGSLLFNLSLGVNLTRDRICRLGWFIAAAAKGLQSDDICVQLKLASKSFAVRTFTYYFPLGINGDFVWWSWSHKVTYGLVLSSQAKVGKTTWVDNDILFFNVCFHI